MEYLKSDDHSHDGETTDMGGDSLTDMGGAAIEDKDDQIEIAVGSLREVESLQPEFWERLDATERVSALQEVEDRIAEVQGRPPNTISMEMMAPGEYGGYSSEEGIVLSEEHVLSDNVHEILDTVAHEGRHAYQDYAINHPGTLSDTELVETWRDNWDNYLTVEEYGQEIYASQPLESDAWEYGARIADAVLDTER